MQIPNTFKLRTGAIQLADLDANFDIIQVTVNTQAESIGKIQTDISNLVTSIANFSAIPIGCIVMWGGTVNSIPSGWRLCDGTNNTPDLRDRFVIGARSDSSGPATTFVTGADTKTGGTKDSVIVNHGHTATSYATSTGSLTSNTDAWDFTIRADDGASLIPVSGSGVSVTQGYDYGRLVSQNYNFVQNTQVTVARSVSHTHTPTISTAVTTTVTSSGETGTNKNLPPYYALAYIMKV
jgi:hypothetical protein